MRTSPRTARRALLAAALAATLTLPAVQTVQAATQAAQATQPAPAAAPATFRAETPLPTGYDELAHQGDAVARTGASAPAPGGGSLGGTPFPGAMPQRVGAPAPTAAELAAPTAVVRTAAGVPCTLDGLTGLGPAQLADFLTDPAVKGDDCLKSLLWTWDARFAVTMDGAHVRAVADRIVQQVPSEDGSGRAHLYELFYFLHAAAYHDFTQAGIDITETATAAAVRRAVDAWAAAPLAFADTDQAGLTTREMTIAAGSTGQRQYQLALAKRVLAKFGPGTRVADSWAWGTAGLAALNLNYLGVNNRDAAFLVQVTADASYRSAFRGFAGYGHLKGTQNEWLARDAMAEYGRFGELPELKAGVVGELGWLLSTTARVFGELSGPWVKVVGWANAFGVCQQYDVCAAKYDAQVFPYTYSYDNGAIQVRTSLDRATVDRMYYASKQVKTQFLRVLGTDAPLDGDPNATLNIRLYPTRSAYELYHPLLTGMGTANGGIYIERGATFYTYQRTTAESYLTLEELFRHEYVHYLNGRWATPGYFGDARWYAGDRLTAMDEGTAEFFDGSTRDGGVKVRQALVAALARDEAAGIPRLSVAELLHARYDDAPAFHFYNYAGTFFEYLWAERPAELRAMYALMRADDPAGFDAWRDRMGADQALQAGYDAFLTAQSARVQDLYVPSTSFTANGYLRYAYASEVQAAIASATANTPTCKDNGDWANKPMRFVCEGRITANLANAADPDQLFKDMSSTVDYFILTRTKGVANNLDDMNCWFGPVEVWPGGKAGTSSYTCEGPLRR
ncbi:collagenase [Kitasatospora sp. NPDC001664]